MEITRDEYRQALSVVIKYRQQIEIDALISKKEVDNALSKFFDIDPDTRIVETNINVRTLNILRSRFSDANITVKDVSNISESKLLRFRGVGVNVLNELREMCYFAGLKMQP